MTDTKPRPETAEQWGAKFLSQHIAGIAKRLHDMADDIQRATREIDRVGEPGRPNYARIAGEVHHTLTWGFANLHVEQVIQYAADADIARAKGE